MELKRRSFIASMLAVVSTAAFGGRLPEPTLEQIAERAKAIDLTLPDPEAMPVFTVKPGFDLPVIVSTAMSTITIDHGLQFDVKQEQIGSWTRYSVKDVPARRYQSSSFELEVDEEDLKTCQAWFNQTFNAFNTGHLALARNYKGIGEFGLPGKPPILVVEGLIIEGFETHIRTDEDGEPEMYGQVTLHFDYYTDNTQ